MLPSIKQHVTRRSKGLGVDTLPLVTYRQRLARKRGWPRFEHRTPDSCVDAADALGLSPDPTESIAVTSSKNWKFGCSQVTTAAPAYPVGFGKNGIDNPGSGSLTCGVPGTFSVFKNCVCQTAISGSFQVCEYVNGACSAGTTVQDCFPPPPPPSLSPSPPPPSPPSPPSPPPPPSRPPGWDRAYEEGCEAAGGTYDESDKTCTPAADMLARLSPLHLLLHRLHRLLRLLLLRASWRWVHFTWRWSRHARWGSTSITMLSA